MSVQEAKTRRAEVKVAVAMVQHNVPFAVADHFSPLYKECFRDSPTAQGFKSASTKTTCIINEAVAPHFKKELVMKMRENPFTLVTDGSNDTGLEKMNPLTVRIFDTNKVVHRFLDMCTTSGRSCGTAEVIYTKINDTLQENDIPWRNCVGLSIDNAPVNTGARNSISARMLKENGSICIHGCPCHIIHNTAKHAGQKFMEISGFDPEDLTVDVGYWFKGSTNRKGYLAEFCEFHESEYMEMLLHISVRWLSLERCITRILRQYGPLTSYFKSLNEKQPRFRRLVDAFSNPLTEVYLLFYQATLPVFTILNLLLQRERSSIFQLHGEMTKFIKKLCARFMKPSALQGEKLNVGFTTRATLNRLLEAGDITPQEVQLFQQTALAFLQRTECGVEDALYFIDRFQELLPFHGPEEQDKVCEKFLEYQLMISPCPKIPPPLMLRSFGEYVLNQVQDKTTVPTQSPAAAKISL
ncbi:Zinc finger BED domain containing protein 5 [Dissostichus eleginoides]|uniref:Zinc finger BED domain containing protein 5 n=1 Tax=Dissostichus eleginoides TaxID=100907 RepID=A0AAD9FBD1_DISEL|nr:Zinc finger BED domain containing protein 5 [Dissostichus eleginoides]